MGGILFPIDCISILALTVYCSKHRGRKGEELTVVAGIWTIELAPPCHR